MNSGNLTLSLNFLSSNFSIPSFYSAVMTLHFNSLTFSQDFVHAFFFLLILNATTTMTFLLLILLGGGAAALKINQGFHWLLQLFILYFPQFSQTLHLPQKKCYISGKHPLITFITDEVSYICALCKFIYSIQKVHDRVSAYYVYGFEKSIFTHVQTHILLIIFYPKYPCPCIPILQTYSQKANVSLLCYWCCAFFNHCDKHHIRMPVISLSTPFCKSHIVSGYLYNLIITSNK